MYKEKLEVVRDVSNLIFESSKQIEFVLIKSLPRQNQDKMETGKGFVSFSRSCSSNIIEATAYKSSQSKEL